MYLLQLIWC